MPAGCARITIESVSRCPAQAVAQQLDAPASTDPDRWDRRPLYSSLTASNNRPQLRARARAQGGAYV